jgi:hypothetical protein
MTDPPKTFRIGSIIWSLTIGTLIVILGASVLLPSTKRARLQFSHPEQEMSDVAVSNPPATQP